MATPDILEQLVQQATRLANSSQLSQDVEGKLRTLVQGAFNRLDVVPRDEFDAQAAVLRRTREKLEKLEQELEKLQAEVDR